MPDVIDNNGLTGVRGQDGALRVLSRALVQGRVPHAYLFTGPDGVGKRAAARAWAQVLLCAQPDGARACGQCGGCQKVAAGAHPDVLWIDFDRQAVLLKEPLEKQKSIKIDTIRQMDQALRLKPMEGRVKVAVIDPADAMVEAAAHALLKILEEPPAQTHLVLLSGSAASLLPTIRSRCQRVRFGPLSAEVLRDLLPGLRAGLTNEAVDAAVESAGGSLSRALALTEEAPVVFDWEAASLSELLGWCEGFGNPRLGRAAAERLIEGLLARFQSEARAGGRTAEDLESALRALHQLRQNANVTLVLQGLFLGLRRRARKKAR